MKLLRYLLPVVIVAVTMVTSLFAQPVRDRDFEAVHEYLNSKRTMDVIEKGHNLTISGDIRTEWRHITERQDGVKLRGGEFQFLETDPDRPLLGRNEFDAEFNLYFDYVCDRAWGVVWLEFDNAAGVERFTGQCKIDPQACGGSGRCDFLCLQKAYMGYNVCCDGETRFDVELGRRPLWTVFDSRVQFNARFDGLLLKYSTNYDCWGDFYVWLGGFLVDERVDWFSLVTEIGLLNIGDWGLDFKYSYINWPKLGGGKNRCKIRNPLGWEFRVSQWLLAYNFDPELICAPAKLYGAFLWNSAAKSRRFVTDPKTPLILTDPKKKGIGWYVGVIIGEVFQEGDWSLDINYQVVEAQCIPDCDVSGIGRGNIFENTFTSTGRGNGNYKGWRVEGLYALTDNLSFDLSIEWSRADDSSIGGKHTFSQLELEAIYAF